MRKRRIERTEVGMELELLWLLVKVDHDTDLGWRIAFPPDREPVQRGLVRTAHPLFCS